MKKTLVLSVLMAVFILIMASSVLAAVGGQTCTDPDGNDTTVKTIAFDSTGGSVEDSCTIYYENPPGSGLFTTEYVLSCDNSDPLVVCNIAEGRCNVVNTVYTEFSSCANGCNDGACIAPTICGQTLTTSHTLTGDIDCTGFDPIVLDADGITFDGAGFTITIDGFAFEATDRTNLNIVNLNLVGDGLHGAALSATGSDVTLTNINVDAFLDGVRVENGDLVIDNVDINDARIGIRAIGPGTLDITDSVINNDPENFESGVFAIELDSVNIDGLTVTGSNSGGIFVWDTPTVILNDIVGTNLVQGITVTDFTSATVTNVNFNGIFTEAMYFSYGDSVTVDNYQCTDVYTCVETNQIVDSNISTGTCTGFDYCHRYDYGTATIPGLTASNGEEVVEATGEGILGTLISSGVTASNVEVCFDLIGGSNHDITALTCSASVTGINLENVFGALITDSSISDALTGVFINAGSTDVRLENNLFSNNVLDINNQGDASGDGNTCDNYINFADDGQAEGCDYSETMDEDGDGEPDSTDKCPGTTVGLGNIVPTDSLNPNHYGDDTVIYGCDCEQILECKPGNNEGEYTHGCSPGTIDVWTQQNGWAPLCLDENGILTQSGEAQDTTDNDQDGIPDDQDTDDDNDGVPDSEDTQSKDKNDERKPDWWCRKHPDKC